MPQEIAAFRDDLEAVPDDALLYRRVDWDKVGGRQRTAPGEIPDLNANCFTDYPEARARELGYPGPCMSVGVSVVLAVKGYSPEDLLKGYEGYGLARVTAGDLRRLQRLDGTPCPQGIMLVPTEVEPWHGVVFDQVRRPRQKPVSKAIARVGAWEIPLRND